MIYLAIFILALTLIRLGVVLSNVLGQQWLRNGTPASEPLVSVLIPARNEEHNIGNILTDLVRHDYRNIEVWVYDDLSEDRTGEIARSFAENDSRFHLLEGGELPVGWMGKNHGCHRLSLHATGEYLLYLDADVSIGRGLIRNAVAHAQKHRLDLFSVFPTQKMETWGEWITVPIMNWILLSLLPLVLTRISPRPSFSAANGQFMMFRAEVYHRLQYHKMLRNVKVEDIAIFWQMKREGLRTHTVLGNRQIQCRMYQSYSDAVTGFTRSVFAFFGGSKTAAFLFGLVTTFGFIPVVVVLPQVYTIFYFAMVVMIRAMISLASRQSLVFNLLLAPLQQLSFLHVLVKAAFMQKRRITRWKGRNVDKIADEDFNEKM